MDMRVGSDPELEIALAKKSLPYSPRYSPRGLFVTLGPHFDSESHEGLLRDTFGSADFLWSADDEFRFNKEDSGLCSLRSAVMARGRVRAGKP